MNTFYSLKNLGLKITVLELSTGNKEVEEWTYSPEGSIHPLKSRPIIVRNFVFLFFGSWHYGSNSINHAGDILILNLVTRTEFWMKKETLIAKLKERAADMKDFLTGQKIVETDRIVIKYRIITNNGSL